MDELQACLRDRFGFDAFLPGQREVVEQLVAGRSAVAVFPTGAGKSLCYQLPSLLFDGLTLVVSPLIALMKDQIDALRRRGIEAHRLDGSLDAAAQREATAAVASGRCRLLYVAPERFNNERFRDLVLRTKIALFAVDEAHCISEWGHNFRPDYLKLAAFARQCGAARVLALTATATDKVLADITAAFEIEPRCAVRTGFYRPNLTLLATPVDGDARDAMLIDRLRARERGPTIVYVTLQRTAERVARILERADLPSRAYHAGLDTDARTEIQDWFMRSRDAIVVATIAFGMGVDKADIRHVYHYNLPKSLESYAQEIGRAGRDGAPATCEMLVCVDDLGVLENFAYGDTPDEDAVRSLVEEIFAESESFSVAETDLAFRHDVRPLVLRTLLAYLELDGYLEAGTPFYATFRFKYLESRPQITSRFDTARAAFLDAVFDQAQEAKVWSTIDVDAAAQRVGSPRDRIVRALDYLAEQRMLEVKASGVRRRYRRLRQPEAIGTLANALHRRLLDRERAEIERLGRVVALAAHDGCQVEQLCAYFSDRLERPCGHCSWCMNGGKPIALPPRPEPAIDPNLWAQALALSAEHPDVLGAPRSLARLLAGVSSPKLTRARLTRHPLHGSMSHIPFATLLAAARNGVRG